jgi:tetratricopeptide (TPR) repeat protein
MRFNLLNCPDTDNQSLYLAMVEDFGRALELEPGETEWHIRRANLYYALGPEYYPEAIADYKVVVSSQPSAGQYLTLGNLYFVEGEMDNAVEAYSRAIEISAPDAASGGSVGLELLDRVVQARPDWPLAYYNRGYQYWLQGDNQQAMDDFRRAAELDPNHYNSRSLLGWLTYLSGDYRRSAEASRAAVSLDPTEPRGHFNQGLALVAAGDTERARQAYEAGIAAANALTATQVTLARYDEALGDLLAVFDDPSGIADTLRAQLTFQKALLQVRLGSADEARSTYEAGVAITEGVEDREARRLLYNEAINDLRAADTDLAETAAELIRLLKSARDQ